MYNQSTRDIVFRSINATAAGSTNVNGTALDLQGTVGDVVRALACIGTLTATQVTKLKLQSSPDNSTWTDVTGSETAAMADGDSNKMLWSEWIRPNARYVRPVVERGTANAVIDSVILIVSNLRSEPPTQDSTVSQKAVAGPSY